MTDDGVTKDDVKVPDGEVGDKINKLFKVEEKDISKSRQLRVSNIHPSVHGANSSFADVVILTAMGEEAAIEAKEAGR